MSLFNIFSAILNFFKNNSHFNIQQVYLIHFNLKEIMASTRNIYTCICTRDECFIRLFKQKHLVLFWFYFHILFDLKLLLFFLNFSWIEFQKISNGNFLWKYTYSFDTIYKNPICIYQLLWRIWKIYLYITYTMHKKVVVIC